MAGMFYPSDPQVLELRVRELVAGGRPSNLVPRALIVPHAGYMYSGQIAGSGYRVLKNLDRPIRRVYLLGPAHRVYTRGVAVPSVDSFMTPLGEIRLDRDAINRLENHFDFIVASDESHADEHSLEVHLPFIKSMLGEFRLVPLVVGDIDPARLVPLMDDILKEDDALLIVSSDLSHYHSAGEARLIDAQTVSIMEQLQWRDLNPERACGCVPVAALLKSAADHGLQATALDVRNSADTAGPSDRVVGYASLVVHAPANNLDVTIRHRLLDLARRAIAQKLETGHSLSVDHDRWSPICLRLAATFITLMQHGSLRGCIGTLDPEEPLVDSVASNAVRAALNDPRFPSLTRDELDHVKISISVLGPTSPMRFESEADLLSQLQPGIDGLVLIHEHHRGTFLPSVWESLTTAEAFLRALKQKAGLPDDFWANDIVIERYTTEYFSE
ncbi:MAG: MEMO1 family protein [marine bacterium B5-7]|nr:MAG: MEMO1 family protein [marine bacterium B5-7]